MLRFTGAYLLDVYNPLATDVAHRFRWPLVDVYNHHGKSGLTSGLKVGLRHVHEEFSLDLALPTPVPQTAQIYHNSSVFPFRATFPIEGTDRTQADRASDIFFGFWETGGFIDDGGEKETAHLDAPDRRLGKFGFTGRRGHSQFAYLRCPDNVVKDWWPINQSRALTDIFKRFGLAIDQNQSYSFFKGSGTPKDTTPENFNIDLGADLKKPNSYKYRYTQYVKDYTAKPEPGSDITVKNGKLALRLHQELGGWIDLDSSKVTFEFELSWKKPDENPQNNFTPNGERCDIKPELSAILFWDQVLPGNLGQERRECVEVENCRYHFGALDETFRSCMTGRKALGRIESYQPQTFLPQLEVEPSAVGEAVRFHLVPPPMKGEDGEFFDKYGLLKWSNPNTGSTFYRYYLTLPEIKDPLAPDEAILFIPVRASFPGAVSEYPQGVPYQSLKLVRDTRNETWAKESGFVSFKVENNEKVSSSPDFICRLGALIFSRNGLLLKDGDSSFLTIFKNSSISTDVSGGTTLEKPIGLHLQLRLAIDSVRPVTADFPRGDRRDRNAPILIPTGTSGVASGEFFLNIEEEMGIGHDWHLTANLFETDIESGLATRSYVVLSQEPFALARFTRKALESLGGLKSGAVATYDSDRRTWQFKKSGGTYRYSLAAQVIGDGTDKPRRHEIQDLATDQDGDLAPYPTGKDGKLIDPISTYLVDFRLPPSAELWVRPSDLERNFVLPEWSSFEIFRQKNDFGLGARLSGFRGEFLYGLSVGIDTAREIGPSNTARVAEIEATTGRVAERTITTEPYEPLDDRWDHIKTALRRRPERLEFWVQDPRNPRPFQSARFTSGVSFALRETALHKPPVPVPGTAPSSRVSKLGTMPVRLSDGGPRYHDGGLPGGALWPLESWSFFEKLLQDPVSSGGTIEKIALSPTGGDADQTALFLGGNVKIISETRSGLVQRQRVEIMGRIAVFWHRAKHVVVYERTVNASAQFAPEEPAKTSTRTRRPVLRKVSEYVELLEPVRRYPDTGHASPRSVGFLDSVRFNSKTIAVDSAWSEDVVIQVDKEDKFVGWKIPLWNRRSARIRPQVYRRPDVSFVTVAEGEGERPLIAQECLDPENLYFYAEATRESDTDTWKPRFGIDAADMISPDCLLALQNKWDKTDIGDGAKRKVNATRILPGYRRFTWRLAPSGQRTRLNAERGEKPIFAGLESITFMRAVKYKSDSEVENTAKAVAMLMETVKVLGDVETQVGHWGRDGQGAPDISDGSSGGPRAGSLLAELKDAIAAKDKLRGKAAFVALQRALGGGTADGFNKKVENIFGETSKPGVALREARDQFNKLEEIKYGKLSDYLTKDDAACDKIADKTVKGVRRKARLIAEEVRAAMVRVKGFMDGVGDDWPNGQSKEVFAERLTNEIMIGVVQVLDGPRADIGDLQSGLETARAAVMDVEADIESAVARGLQRVHASSAAYDRSKPWSEARLNEFSLKLQSEVDGISGDISSALAEARQRLSTEMSETSQKFAALAASVLTQVVKTRTFGLQILDKGKIHVRETALQVVTTIDKFYDAESDTGIYFSIRILIDKFRVKDERNDYKEEIENLEKLLTFAVNRILDLRKELVSEVSKISGTMDSLKALLSHSSTVVEEIVGNTIDTVTEAITLAQEPDFIEMEQELLLIKKIVEDRSKKFELFLSISQKRLNNIGAIADWSVKQVIGRIEETAAEVRKISDDAFVMFEEGVGRLAQDIEKLRTALGTGPTGQIPKLIRTEAVGPAVDALLWPLPAEDFADLQENRERILDALVELADKIEAKINSLETSALGAIDDLKTACNDLANTLFKVREELIDEAGNLIKVYKKKLNDAFKEANFNALTTAVNNWNSIKDLTEKAEHFEGKLRDGYNAVGQTVENARAFGDRLLDRAANLGDGGLAAAPNNILRLYSAATTAPEIALLQSNIDRLRATFRDAEDIIRSTKANALFAQLGDALKSIGLELPFDKIGGQFEIDETALAGFDIGQIFRNFGGLKLDNLFEGIKPPNRLNNYVRLSHDFDPKQGRAWVQVAVTLPMPGRQKLFQLGPFAAYFRNPTLNGFVRLDADKDSDRVRETGDAQIGTAIEMEISGQQIVTLEKVLIRYTQEDGLDFDFDPKSIKLNKVFQFVQDTLGSIFPGEFGGMTIVKDRGIPVGLEHEFSMPPMSLNFGTSGIANISISNRFRLLAYPDFALTDRFNLSRPEQPFIFSIFIIGGCGYVQCDTEYRPFDKTLSVTVETAAGGSAALAFAFGPVAGSVYITLSVALSYRKMIEMPGGGLSVSAVLTIGGNVSLWGMVHIFLSLVLRMTYRSNGQIDASGDLRVKVQVCKWVELKYRTTVKYKLRGGHSSTQTTSSTTVEPGPKVKEIEKKAKRLKGVRV